MDERLLIEGKVEEINTLLNRVLEDVDDGCRECVEFRMARVYANVRLIEKEGLKLVDKQ